jgi:hypothetical protein
LPLLFVSDGVVVAIFVVRGVACAYRHQMGVAIFAIGTSFLEPMMASA